mgnify:CR=1 FL=1
MYLLKRTTAELLRLLKMGMRLVIDISEWGSESACVRRGAYQKKGRLGMSAAQRGKRMSEYLCEDVQTGRRGGRDAAWGLDARFKR